MQPACLVWRPAPAGRNKLFGMVDLQQRNDSLLESFFNTTPLRNKALVFPALNPGTSNSYFPVRFFSSPCGKVKNGACISGPSPYGSRPIIVAPDQAGRKIRENMVWGEIFPLSFLFLVPLSFLFLASLPFFPILPPDFFFFFLRTLPRYDTKYKAKIRENMVLGEIFPLSFLFLASLPFFPILPPDFFFFFLRTLPRYDTKYKASWCCGIFFCHDSAHTSRHPLVPGACQNPTTTGGASHSSFSLSITPRKLPNFPPCAAFFRPAPFSLYGGVAIYGREPYGRVPIIMGGATLVGVNWLLLIGARLKLL